MIFLSKLSGFDFKVDNLSHELILGDNVKYDDVLEGTMDHVRKCLINRELDVPIHLYRVHQNLHLEGDKILSQDGDYQYDLLLMPPNVTGIEYVKTHGHRSPFVSDKQKLTFPTVIEILYGAATILLQRFSDDFDPVYGVGSEVEKVYMIKAQKGSKVIIPPNYYYTLINTRGTYLVTGRLRYRWDGKVDREKVEAKHGFAYYIIRKNARQEIVLNPHYKEVPRLEKIKSDDLTKMVSLRSQKPLIEILRKYPEKLEFLKKPQIVNWSL